MFVSVFAICLGLCFSVCFFPPLFFLHLYCHDLWLAGSSFQDRGGAWVSGVGALNPGCWTASELLAPGKNNWWELTQRSPSRIQDKAPTNCLQDPVLDASWQTTSKTGTQSHPSADRLHKVVLNSQTPQKTPPDMALAIRRTRYSSTHQNAGTSPSHQEAYPRTRTKCTYWGQTPEAKRTMTMKPEERRPQPQ